MSGECWFTSSAFSPEIVTSNFFLQGGTHSRRIVMSPGSFRQGHSVRVTPASFVSPALCGSDQGANDCLLLREKSPAANETLGAPHCLFLR